MKVSDAQQSKREAMGTWDWQCPRRLPQTSGIRLPCDGVSGRNLSANMTLVLASIRDAFQERGMRDADEGVSLSISTG